MVAFTAALISLRPQRALLLPHACRMGHWTSPPILHLKLQDFHSPIRAIRPTWSLPSFQGRASSAATTRAPTWALSAPACVHSPASTRRWSCASSPPPVRQWWCTEKVRLACLQGCATRQLIVGLKAHGPKASCCSQKPPWAGCMQRCSGLAGKQCTPNSAVSACHLPPLRPTMRAGLDGCSSTIAVHKNVSLLPGNSFASPGVFTMLGISIPTPYGYYLCKTLLLRCWNLGHHAASPVPCPALSACCRNLPSPFLSNAPRSYPPLPACRRG